MSSTTNVYLIDTGATISIFKIDKLPYSYQINDSTKCKITGIKEGFIETLGQTTTNLIIDNMAVTQNFHIVDSDFPIPADGILGMDFIANNSCILDYSEWKLIFNPEGINASLVIPIYDSPYTNDAESNPTVLTLPPRSEVVRRINSNHKFESTVVQNQQIAEGIFVARAIIDKKTPFVKILNTTNETVTLYNVDVKVEDLSDYMVIDTAHYKANNRDLVLQKLKKNFPEFAKDKLEKLCSEFLDIFALESDQVTVNNFYKQKLRMRDNQPVYKKNYRLPKIHKDIINEKVEVMLKNGTIKPSTSEYNSPILLVPKKSLPGNPEKRWRFCVDYREVNKKLLADRFPLPRMDDLLDQLGRARFFSIIDLLNGFYQIELDEESKDITSFSTDKGSFKFNSIPFGLKIGPNSFQRMMTIAFSGLSPSKCFIYMDDLVVIAVSEDQMIKNLTEIFQTCRKFNLKLNPDKCQFFRKEVTYLGHKCTENGIMPDDSKFSIITNYPKPKNPEEVRRFVSFCNYYRRFVPNFAHHSLHLTNLTRKKVEFHWSDKCEIAFQYLKNALQNPPILKYPDFSKPFCITTDASKLACGAILSQEYDGIDCPISYASRAFTPGERNKSTPLQELTAIHWALQFFRPYVYGIRFLVKSDHRSLVYLFTMKNPSSKLNRMRLELEEYDFEIEYIKGKNNVGADALSRINFDDIKQLAQKVAYIRRMTTRTETRKQNEKNEQNLGSARYKHEKDENPKVYEVNSPTEVRKLPRVNFNLHASNPQCVIKNGKQTLRRFSLTKFIDNDTIFLDELLSTLDNLTRQLSIKTVQLSLNESIFELISAQTFKNSGTRILKHLRIALTPKTSYIKNNKDKLDLMSKFHDDPMFGGHCGTRRMYAKLRLKYFWHNMTKDIADFVRKCGRCQTNKTKAGNRENLTHTPTPQFAFDIIIVDTIGPFITSNRGNKYAVTLICDLSKYIVTIPVPDKEAITIAKAIFEHFILSYGPMQQLLSDRGTEYINSILEQLCKLLKITHNKSTANHHRTVGTIERSHRTFNEYVRSYINEGKTDWDEWLTYFTYCYNTTPSTAIQNYCPFQLIFGRIPQNYEFLKSDHIDPVYNIDAYYQEVRFKLQSAHKRAQVFLEQSKLLRKENYDKKAKPQTLEINDLVLLKNCGKHKLDPLFHGPFQVKEISEPNVVIIDKNNKNYIVHKDNVKKFEKSFYYRFID